MKHELKKHLFLNKKSSKYFVRLLENFQGDQAPAKVQKMLKKFENSSTKTVAKQSMTLQMPFGTVTDFARIS
jgi:hypothetical protein